MPEHLAEYHHRPSPHFLFDRPSWENALASFGAREDTRIMGQIGWATGIPVYIDECPALWKCKATDA